ncbi:phosphoenolpyruvate hydrolase family protein [Bradyrhizobium sp. PMVTL-01]|uniref:phosphoenolpyruvate hydrolase family protein n=1 Tax=Bradyrhizobium sp. PMVTL-01 TaxID=3434999 RepID=UPI003F71A9CA
MFERTEILSKIARQVAEGKTILAAASSCGLVAKCAVLGAADMLVVYSTGFSRLMGLPTSRIGDSNARTLELAAEIRNVVSSVACHRRRRGMGSLAARSRCASGRAFKRN